MGGSVPIRALVRVDLIGYIGDEKTLTALEALHTFTAETVRKRFHYRHPGLWVLGARVWRARSRLCDRRDARACRMQDVGGLRSSLADQPAHGCA